VHPEPLSKRRVRQFGLANRCDLLGGKLGPSRTFAAADQSALNRITNIVSDSAFDQVGWIATRLVVASVPRHGLRPPTVRQEEREAMRRHLCSPENAPHAAISMREPGSGPRPALVGVANFHERPEPDMSSICRLFYRKWVQRALLGSLSAFYLSGCASTSPVSDYCLIAKPIFDSPQDTPETRAQVLEHNSAWVCRCEDDCQ
jgi:hypothetical protein